MDVLTKKRLGVVVGLLGLMVISGTIPLPQSLHAPCFLEPSVVWVLSRTGTAEMITSYERNWLNAGAPRLLLHFERPDLVEITIPTHLRDGSMVAAGDTVAIISSREGLGRVGVLEASLEKGQLEREALIAGARIQDIAVAKASLHRADVARNAYAPEYERVKKLFESSLVAKSAWDSAQGLYQLLVAEQQLAQAELNALEAGARVQDIQVAQGQVEVWKRSMEGAQRVLGSREFITSPISGRIRISGPVEALIRVERIDSLAVMVSLPETALPVLYPGYPVQLTFRADPKSLRSAQLWQFNFFPPDSLVSAYAVGILDNKDLTLLPGMSGTAQVPLGKQTLLSGLRLKTGL